MFRALLCPSSGAHDYNVDYRIGRFVLSEGRGNVNVKLWFLVVCVRCEVGRLVVDDNLFLLTLIVVILCAW
jgi:hypothetical protein